MVLAIGLFGPLTLQELKRHIGGPEGTIYDNVRALGNVTVEGKAGLRLVRQLPASPDSTAHRFDLTERGRMMVEAIAFELTVALAPNDEEDEPLRDYFAAVRSTRV